MSAEQLPGPFEPEVGEGAELGKSGRLDPAYDLTTTQYRAPVAEARRGFWSRFWFVIPLVLLLIALPFVLRACDTDSGEELATPALSQTCCSTCATPGFPVEWGI